ncbi:MAG: hypothetical protein D6675_05125 [Gemmatimonadetes bacterium]|nr:MAG: hypothetical protein D6675_05125 [Gemmatimonadota bacterium]
MRNHAPIFLNCFSRGGSNILWNLFITHPDVCSPQRETLEIFRTHPLKNPKLAGYQAVILSRQWGLFDQWNLKERKPIPKAAQLFIDKKLYEYKLTTFSDPEMKYKYEGEVYTLEEVQQSRLVAKNNNGLTFLSPIFQDMYPDATFIALVRHPFAIYESYKRRKIMSSADQFARFYRKITGKMLFDAENLPNYHVITFESILKEPQHALETLYKWTHLELSKVKKLRFKAKGHLQPDGTHGSSFEIGKHYWFELDRIYDIIDPQINQHQTSRLSDAEKQTILRLIGDNLTALGYTADNG